MAHHCRAAAMAVALITCVLLQSSSAAEDFRGLNGTWEGSLTYVQGPGWYFPNRTEWTRLVIQANSPRVYLKQDNKIKEIIPGQFKIERLRTNAIIFAIDTGTDADGTWVQNWLFAVTEKDQDTLIVNFYVMANNLNMPLSNSYSKWTSAAAGELKRAR